MPSFSVIIPVFNGEHSLEECLNSVANQNYTEFEVIIVNDGSTDGSEQIIQDWIGMHLDLDVKFIAQENLGLGAARNNALKMSTKEYVAFLDCDDLWHSEKLKQVNLFLTENKNTHWLYHPVLAFGLGNARRRFCYQVRDSNSLLIKGNPIVPSACILSSSLIQKHQFSIDVDFHGAEDLHLWLTLLEEKFSPKLLNETLASYREDGGMSTQLDDHLKKVFAVLKLAHQKGLVSEKQYQKAIARKYFESGRFHQKRKNFVLAEQYYTRAALNTPKSISLRLTNFFGLSF